jgi:hypothetical protein
LIHQFDVIDTSKWFASPTQPNAPPAYLNAKIAAAQQPQTPTNPRANIDWNNGANGMFRVKKILKIPSFCRFYV